MKFSEQERAGNMNALWDRMAKMMLCGKVVSPKSEVKGHSALTVCCTLSIFVMPPQIYSEDTLIQLIKRCDKQHCNHIDRIVWT